jgi:predicted regulator of Ras-like GTPase activity (Roadblock/LC7/MglB family)
MTFRNILSTLVENVDGALGAMFLDDQGESVEVVTRSIDPYEMQVIGAYQGIFLDHVRRICSAFEHGRLEQFKIDWRNSTMFNVDLADGYYLVLVCRRGIIEAIAWRALLECRELLIKEIE